MKKTFAAAGVFALAACTIAAEPAHSTPVPHRLVQPVIIGTDLPLQGSTAEQSADTNRLLRIYLGRRHNRAGNYPVKLKAYDDSTPAAGQWDDAACARNAQAHARNQQELAVLGTFNSGCAADELPTLNRAGLLMVSHSNTYPGLTLPWDTREPQKYYPTGKRTYARVAASDIFQADAAARYLHGTLHKNRVYVLDDGLLYGRGIAKAFVASAQSLGMTVVGMRSWDARRDHYRALFHAVAAARPTALYLGGIYDNNGGRLLTDERAVLGHSIPIVAPDGFTGYPELDRSSVGQGVYLTFSGLSRPALLRGNPVAQRLDAAFRAKYHRPPVGPYPFQAVAAMQVICAAIAGSDGTRAGVVRQVFGGSGITIPKSRSLFGRAFRISNQTGDIDLKQLTVEVIRSHREQGVRTYRFRKS